MLLYETDNATVVVDPLVPDSKREPFWSALDRDVKRQP
jgi:hypothetical protein